MAPMGDPAGYLPRVKKSRKRKKTSKGKMPAKPQHDMKAMRRKAFMGG